MKKIPVGKQHFALVDDEDYEWLSQHSWRVQFDKLDTIYALTGESSKYMHALITGFEMTDHANGNGLDNRRENLRDATHSQNNANRRKFSTSILGKPTSDFKGVTWNKNRNRWQAQIKVHGKSHYLGLYEDEVVAARAYDDAARFYFGEFARPNMRLSQPGEGMV